jgi:hypothetical protein
LEKYTNQFLLTLTKITGLSTAQQVMLYTIELASTLQIDIQLQQPPDLETTMALARKFQPTTPRQQSVQREQPDDQDIQISLNAVTGITTSQTMQVQLSINGRDFLALLDSGSTHNFITVKKKPTTSLIQIQQLTSTSGARMPQTLLKL